MTQITIPNVPIEVEYSVVLASTGPFTVPFPFFAEGDVRATVTDAVGAVTNLLVTTGFTFTTKDAPVGQEGNGYSGGSITLVASIGADAGTTLRIYRSTIIDRTSNYPNTGPFSMPLLNDEQNKHIAIMQEVATENDDLEADIEANETAIAANVIAIANNAAAISNMIATPGVVPNYPISAAETAAGVTPADYSYPVGYVERYGGAGDGVTDNKGPIDNAILACKGTGVPVTLGTGTYNVTFIDNGTGGRWFNADDSLIFEGASTKLTKVKFLPDATSIIIRGFLTEGTDLECRDMTFIPPTQSVASTNFDDLTNLTAFWINPAGIGGNVLIERVNCDIGGFETAVQISGDGSAGWKVHLKECVMYAYSVPVAGSNSDDSVANDALRELWIHDCTFYGHENEGPDWSTRGRVIYVHPNFSLDYRNIKAYGSGSGRTQVSHYSSGAVLWNAYPPRYVNYNNVRMYRLNDSSPSTEGLQTSNLVGTVSMIENCVFDVDEIAMRVRHNCVIHNCQFKGITKAVASQDPGAIKTRMKVAGVATDTTITVDDASIFSDTDPIFIHMDDNTQFETTVNGAPAGNVITLTDQLPSSVAIDRWVIQEMFFSEFANGNTTEWIKLSDCTFTNDSNSDAMIVGKQRIDIFADNCTFDINSHVTNSEAYNDIWGARFFSRNNTYRQLSTAAGMVILDNANAEAHFNGDTFISYDSISSPFNLQNASQITMNNCQSFTDVASGPDFGFSSGAPGQGIMSGANNKWWGQAWPRCTDKQVLTPGCGMDPADVTRATITELDPNYDVHRVAGTGTITNVRFGGHDIRDGNWSGRVTLLAVDGFTITHGTRMLMPGGIDLVLAADEAVSLIFDSINNKVVGVTF